MDISKSTFSRITKHDLKWHPYKMHVRKERIKNYVNLLKENQNLLIRVMAGMLRRMQSDFDGMGDISKETEISRVH